MARNSRQAKADAPQILRTSFHTQTHQIQKVLGPMALHLRRQQFVDTAPKRFVYILQSVNSPERHYTGLTSDVQQRLLSHNKGASIDTRADRPWQLAVVVELRTEELAVKLERYLKSGSGRAFARKHF